MGPVTDCRFRIRRSCQNDNECPLNHKCCNRGCEKKECYSVRPDSKTKFLSSVAVAILKSCVCLVVLNPCIDTTCPINSRCIVGPDRRPTCIPILFPSDPCIAATCLINQRCIARNGKPRCIPLLKSTGWVIRLFTNKWISDVFCLFRWPYSICIWWLKLLKDYFWEDIVVVGPQQ